MVFTLHIVLFLFTRCYNSSGWNDHPSVTGRQEWRERQWIHHTKRRPVCSALLDSVYKRNRLKLFSSLVVMCALNHVEKFSAERVFSNFRLSGFTAACAVIEKWTLQLQSYDLIPRVSRPSFFFHLKNQTPEFFSFVCVSLNDSESVFTETSLVDPDLLDQCRNVFHDVELLAFCFWLRQSGWWVALMTLQKFPECTEIIWHVQSPHSYDLSIIFRPSATLCRIGLKMMLRS